MPSAAFLVVGHAQSGKSTTLRALAGKHGRRKIGDKDFFVRLMSNDDVLKGYREFIKALDPRKKPYVLLAYCPEDGPPKLLEELARKYTVHAFVLEQSATGGREVSASEIAVLKRQGPTIVTQSRNTKPAKLAQALQSFIAEHL